MASEEQHKFKSILIIFSIVFSFYTLRGSILPNRAIPDEKLVSMDIFSLLNSGSLGSSISYIQGNGYPVITSVILKIIGHEYDYLEVLSPTIGSIFLVLYAIFITRIFFNRIKPIPLATIFLTFFSFAGFITRIGESSHKKYTFLIFFTGLFLLVISLKRSDSRFNWLLISILPIFSIFNYIWGVVYGTAIVFPLVFLSTWRFINGFAILSIFNYTLPEYLPTAQLNTRYFRMIIGRLATAGVNNNAGGEATSETAAWGIVSIGKVSLPVWFIYTSGIFVIAFANIISGLVCIKNLINRRRPIDLVFICVVGWMSIFAIVFIASGDLGTFKRVIVIPGVLGIGYLLSEISQINIDYSKVKVVFLIIMLISAGLAVPRTVVDDPYSPYDHYADSRDMTRIEWQDNYMGESCTTNAVIDLYQRPLQIEEKTELSFYAPQEGSKLVYSDGDSQIRCQ